MTKTAIIRCNPGMLAIAPAVVPRRLPGTDPGATCNAPALKAAADH